MTTQIFSQQKDNNRSMEITEASSTKETPSLISLWLAENNWLHAKLKFYEASYIWKIDDFSSLCKKSLPYSTSNLFWAVVNPNIKWNLGVMVHGNTVKISLYFPFTQNEVMAKYTLTIYDNTKREAKVVRNKLHVFGEDSNYITEVMCTKDEIFSANANILSNDELAVGCEVKYFYNNITINAEVNWNPEIMNSKLCDFDNLELMFDRQKFTDVKINVSGRTFEAHKAILAAASSVFLAMFENSMTEAKRNYINIDDIDGDTFEEMLRFIYTGNVNNIESVAYTLFAAADKYAIDKLKHICQIQLCKNITADNAVRILILADLHSAVELKEKLIEFIRIERVDVSKAEDFNTMIDSHRGLLAEVIHALTKK